MALKGTRMNDSAKIILSLIEKGLIFNFIFDLSLII
jgi:hypothetical protein